MTEYELDELLQAPLPEIADNGFSARLLERLEKERMREKLIFAAALLITATGVLAFLPWQYLVTKSVVDLTSLTTLITTPTIYFTIAALSLFLCWERQTAKN